MMRKHKQTNDLSSHYDNKLIKLKSSQECSEYLFKAVLIRSLYSLLFAMFTIQFSFATIFTPPSGKIRGMYVSCGEELIIEIKNNTNAFDSINDSTHISVTPNVWGLLNYCRNHYISYISV
ncbi:MAG: hypothetical protein IPO70_00470 [Bacteroidetes bacterium]|nr:hypothetical protein [Bacteroidota bacterium]